MLFGNEGWYMKQTTDLPTTNPYVHIVFKEFTEKHVTLKMISV